MLPTEADLAKMAKIEFPYAGRIRFMHDHGFYKGLPHTVWWISGVNGDWVSLVRPGYGTKEKYGDGAIGVPLSSLSLAAVERERDEKRKKEERILAEAKEINSRRSTASMSGG